MRGCSAAIKRTGSARHTVSDICEVSVTCGHMNRCYGYCFRIRRKNGAWLFDAECFTHNREEETVFEDRAVNGGDIEELPGILERNDSIAYAENYKKPIKLPLRVLDDTSYNFSLTFSEGNRTVVPKDVYREVNDLEPTVIGDTVRQGFSAVSAGVPLIVLWMTRPYRIRICLWPDMGKGYVSLEDADVRTVIGSIRIK